jgi:hypothetical protein
MMNRLTFKPEIAHALQQSYEGIYVDVDTALKALERMYGQSRRHMLMRTYLAYNALQKKLGPHGRRTVAADYVQCQKNGWIRLPGYALMVFVRAVIPETH